MPSAKLITYKIINVLGAGQSRISVLLIAFITLISISNYAQDNSPYSRYGLGDVVPSTNINSRGMGSISSAYNDILSINFNNPASYGSFQTIKELGAKKIMQGRAILDVGINIENRTLREPDNVEKFTSSNALFSHIQIGLPLKSNWGLSFGLRPITRISYNMSHRELLMDPDSGLPIDSAVTLSEGNGGLFLASLGLGHRIIFNTKHSLSIGFNGGYLFGQQDYSTRRSLFNDSISYISANFQTITSYGNLFFNTGLQYRAELGKNVALTIGANGNWKQDLNASQDVIKESFFFDESTGYSRLDSVYDQRNLKGTVVMPASITVGFTVEKSVTLKQGGWLFGIDYLQNKATDYRSFGQADPALRDKWEVRAGAQIRPVPKNNYFSNVSYRAGVFYGEDYIYVNEKLPVLGTSFGLGLPVRNFNRQNEQFTIINLAFEFINRGTNDNLLKENLFRISAGFSLSDLWFLKRKYN